MAITIDDFSKIWASTSPLTPYSFSDDNYKQGWNFVGSTPPSRQMWDFLQKQNDEKLKYLLDNFNDYLPLSGGTMTGAIEGNPVTLTADDGNGNVSNLVVNPNGTTTLDGNEVITYAMGCRCIKGFTDKAGIFTLKTNLGASPFAVIVSFAGTTTRTQQRIYFANGYGSGSTARTNYWRVPFSDSNDGDYTVAVSSNANQITFTRSSTNNLYYSVLVLAEAVYGDVQFTFTQS